MSWTLDPTALELLKHIFRGTLSPNNSERASANTALEEAKAQPEFENYLFALLVSEDSVSSDVRAAAGINLKNSVLRGTRYGMTSRPEHLPDRTILLENIFQGLIVPTPTVRNITGNVITSLFSIYGIEKWPHALPRLLDMAKGGQFNTTTQEAAMSALAKICEDSYDTLDTEYNGERPLNFMMTTFLDLMSSDIAKIRALSIHCINQFIEIKSQSFLVVADQYLAALFQLAEHDDPEIRQNVCRAFTLLLDVCPQKLTPHLSGVISYCLHLLRSDNDDVALEACEFLLGFSTAAVDDAQSKQLFAPHLEEVLPLLLEKMVYSEEEKFLLEIADSNDNAHVADRDEDIRPQNAKSKDSHTASKAKGTFGSGSNGDPNSDDESDNSDDDDDEELLQWSLRKSAAATLDVLSDAFPMPVLNIALPILQQRIVASDWLVREAAILAFGAMSQGCMDFSSDKLPELVPFLVERLGDPEPQVRQIGCWTLLRYSAWVALQAESGGPYALYYAPTIEALVRCGTDEKKVVQQAASSALLIFIEELESDLLQAYMGPMLEFLSRCLQQYQRKNMMVLYDCIQVFVDKMGYDSFAANPSYVQTLMPPLMARWHSLTDDDEGLWPLLECMLSVAPALGDMFAPYAVEVYQRGVRILSHNIERSRACHTDPLIEIPELDLIVTSLDMIDGLIQGFGSQSLDLMGQSASGLMEVILACFEENLSDVRQLAYALLGDLAIFVFDAVLSPILSSVFVAIGHEIDHRSDVTFAVCNNAIWSLGEMVMRLSYEQIHMYAENFVGLLITVLHARDSHSSVQENVAICLGRLGLVSGLEPTLVPHVVQFILAWCKQMLMTSTNNEKEDSFRGMLSVVASNPETALGNLETASGKLNLAQLVSCISKYEDPSHELQVIFGQVLTGYEAIVGAEVWSRHIMPHVEF